MARVQTVLGPIDSAALGFTLMHEHLMIANWSMRQAFSDWIDVDAHVEYATGEARSALERGVRTIVDATPINLGRDIDVMRRVAERSGIQVIASTGLYYTEEIWIGGWEPDALADFFVRDIERGIQGTSARAGILKCATDHAGVTALNRKLLVATARAHRRTGVPITTHTSVAERIGLAQQDVFEAEGVDLSRVVIGHCGDSPDVAYLEAILRRGSTIGMDRFGLNQVLPFEQRVATIAELVRRGWAERMVLSHDACCYIDLIPGGRAGDAMPQWNFRHIPDDVIPALRKAGVPDSAIRAMSVDNPRRVFERQGAY